MLQHLDTNEGIERMLKIGWNISVVHEVDADHALEAGSPDPFFCESLLLDG